jgi:LPS sulfotransferase NodH
MLKMRFRYYMDWIIFNMSFLLYEIGISGGHKDYRRFIILTTARSGSNFLRGLLNSHSQVIAFGELFRGQKTIGWDLLPYDDFLQSQRLISTAQQDPASFLENTVFKSFPRKTKAVGFKIFYYHAQNESRSNLWRFLKDHKNFYVIHLKRTNTLKTMLSLKKAFITNRWTNTTGAPEEKLSITLDYEECLEHFNWEKNVKNQYDLYFEDHPKIEVTYEDLANNAEREIKRIQSFLGVDYQICKPTTKEQANQQLSQAISNYFELKGKFQGTQWEVFFEE